MSRIAFRIVKAAFTAAAFDGEGARQFGGRWNSPGVAMVYTSATQSLAMLEMLVHLQSRQVIDSYVVIPIEFDEGLVKAVDERKLPADWRSSPAPPSLLQIGNDWATSNASAVMRVPSVIVPRESNYLLNPNHPDFAKLNIGKAEPLTLDSRLK